MVFSYILTAWCQWVGWCHLGLECPQWCQACHQVHKPLFFTYNVYKILFFFHNSYVVLLRNTSSDGPSSRHAPHGSGPSHLHQAGCACCYCPHTTARCLQAAVPQCRTGTFISPLLLATCVQLNCRTLFIDLPWKIESERPLKQMYVYATDIVVLRAPRLLLLH